MRLKNPVVVKRYERLPSSSRKPTWGTNPSSSRKPPAKSVCDTDQLQVGVEWLHCPVQPNPDDFCPSHVG